MGVLEEAHKNFDFEIVDEFIDHFDVMKDLMQPTVLALENKDMYSSHIEELFRIFHNLKSASSYLRFERINRLAAFVENSLEEARRVSGPANEAYIDWLLKVADQFNLWYLDLVNDHEKFTQLDFSIFNDPSAI
ncbi:MAG: Hpt domain-containing protein [Helicobacteraceae bacterium]|jgi:two-component system chemotaxis sensor kinase CheA|nr:Hpt domain-containing protein [Helicobacteraceae bacterium]